LENFDSKLFFVKHDPWLGGNTARICSQADINQPWVNLLSRSTHINHLVSLDHGWKLIPENVVTHTIDNVIIVNMSCDPFRGWEEQVVDELQKYKVDFVVLSGDAKYLHQPKPYICFVPYLYLWQRYSYDPVIEIHQPRQYSISCMNKMARYHRIENFVKLKRKSYFKDLLFHMWYYYDKTAIKRQCPSKYYNRDIITEFESLIPKQVSEFNDDPHSISLPAYTDSYINLVTETSIFENTIFISEKTWRPFMCGQFGLWLGNPGTVQFLRSCGFDVFDDVFDNHNYDLEPNLNLRIDMLHDTIDKIMRKDLYEIWVETLSRRQQNIEKFHSIDLENYLTSQCKEYQL
jgi:hypothetical protein